MMDRLGMDDSQPIESKMVSRAVESAQKRVEGNNFDARKTILAYDDVLREQREIIYKQRFEVIDAENDEIRKIIEQMIQSSIRRVVDMHTQDDDESNWDLKTIIEYAHGNLLSAEDISIDEIRGKDTEEIIDLIMQKTSKKNMMKKKKN